MTTLMFCIFLPGVCPFLVTSKYGLYRNPIAHASGQSKNDTIPRRTALSRNDNTITTMLTPMTTAMSITPATIRLPTSAG